MRVEYINPFVESTLKDVICADVHRGKIYLNKHAHLGMEISTYIGLQGDIKGHVLYGMTFKTAVDLVSVMNGEIITSFDDLGKATITELVNMIIAKAVDKLYELGYKFSLTTPSILTKATMDSLSINLETLIIPIVLTLGRKKRYIYCQVCFF